MAEVLGQNNDAGHVGTPGVKVRQPSPGVTEYDFTNDPDASKGDRNWYEKGPNGETIHVYDFIDETREIGDKGVTMRINALNVLDAIKPREPDITTGPHPAPGRRI